MSIDLLKIGYKIPQAGDSNFEPFTIKSGNDVLIIRAPLAADYILIDEIKAQYQSNNHARFQAIALRLAVSWNGKPGVSPMEVGSLTRKAYKELTNMINQFQLDIVPDSAINLLPDSIKKLMNDKLELGDGES